jgi:hypothetical protein
MGPKSEVKFLGYIREIVITVIFITEFEFIELGMTNANQ